MKRMLLAALVLAAVGLSGGMVLASSHEPTVATETFTNVVTYTIPTVVETTISTVTETVISTVTETVTAPTTTAPTTTAPTEADIGPGDSWDAAYEAAEWGDTILLAPGHYGSQQIISAKGDRDGLNPHIVFQPVPGAVVTLDQLSLHAPHITVRGVDTIGLKIDGYDTFRGGDLLIEDVHTRSGDLTSAQNITYRRVEFGPNTEGTSSSGPWPQDAYIINAWPTNDGNHPKNVLIEDSVFHDVVEPTDTAHSDCLQFTAGEQVTIRGTAFLRCEHADIMIAPDQGPILDFVIEDNYFDATLSAFYSINASHKEHGVADWNNVVVRGNTEAQNTRLDAPRMRYEGNKADSMSSNKCSTALGVGTVVQSNTYKSGIACGPGDVVDPNVDLSYDGWLTR